MSKLKNVKAIKEMLSGTHKTQTKKTVSFNETNKQTIRSVGERWVDDNKQEWEQKDGYRVKVGNFSKLRSELKSFPNCRKETCECCNPGQADLKMKAYHGMCLNCVVEVEHELKLKGEYETYEKTKLLHNAENWLRDAELEKEAIKLAVKAQFINEDGSIENWNGMSESAVLEKIDTEFEKFKTNFIETLKQDLSNEKNPND